MKIHSVEFYTAECDKSLKHELGSILMFCLLPVDKGFFFD